MQIIDEIVGKNILDKLCRIEDFYAPEDFVMFDIETTGLSAERAFIYLIGINHYKDGEWHITLYFNDDGISESEILENFMDFIKDKKVLAHFNGDNFDIPFVSKRIDILNMKSSAAIANNFHLLESVDLLKIVRPYKNSLGLPNIRQKTVERYLGINRIDMYDGGQMIGVYLNYLSLFKSLDRYDLNPERYRDLVRREDIEQKIEDQKSLFIQHNRDDMEGMFHLTSILAVRALSRGENESIKCSFEEVSGRLYLIMNAHLKYRLPGHIDSPFKGVSLLAEDYDAYLRIPVQMDTLRYYYGGTKKSFSEKSGFFIKQPKESVTAEYKEAPKDKESYLLLDDQFLGNEELIQKYFKGMMYHMLYWK